MAEPLVQQPSPIVEPKPMSPNPQPLDVRAELRAEQSHMLARERRIKTFESINRVSPEIGRALVGHVVREAIAERIATPVDMKYPMPPQVQRQFLDLHDAQNEIQGIFEEKTRTNMPDADLAKRLAIPLAASVYQRREGGLEELRELSDEQIIREAQDFPATATRELFLRNYLIKLNHEFDGRRAAAAVLLRTAPDAPLPKKELAGAIKNVAKYQTQGIRELGSLAHTLGFTQEEQESLGNGVFSFPRVPDFPQLSAPEMHQANAVEWQHRLIKQSIRNITGDTQEPALDINDPSQDVTTTKHKEIFLKVQARADIYEEAGRTIQGTQEARQRNALAMEELSGEVLKRSFKDYARAGGEKKLAGLKKAISAVEKNVRGKFRLLAVRRQGIDRLLERDTNLIGDTVRQFGKEVKTVTTDGQVTPSTEEMVALAQKPYESLAKGVDRVEGWAENRANGHVDKIVELGKLTPDDVALQDGRVVKKEPVVAVKKEGEEESEDVIAQEAKAAVAKIEVVEQTPDTATQVQQEMEARVADDPKLVEKIAEVVQGPRNEQSAPGQPHEAGEKASAVSDDPLRLVVDNKTQATEPKEEEIPPEIAEKEQEMYDIFLMSYRDGVELLKKKQEKRAKNPELYKDEPLDEAIEAAETYTGPYLLAHRQEAGKLGIGGVIHPFYMDHIYKAQSGETKHIDSRHFDLVARTLADPPDASKMTEQERNTYGFEAEFFQTINKYVKDALVSQTGAAGGAIEERKAA